MQQQHEIGIDVVSDGEMSKPSYATYVTERLTGFGGKSDRPKLSDILEYPNVASHYFNDPGVLRLNQNRPACNGPVAPKGLADAQTDIDNFRGRSPESKVAEAFMTAASPGVVSMFLGNTYYPTEEEFLWAVAEAMKPEYEAIVEAGFVLQLDCPDLAMTRHREFADLPVEEFRDYVETAHRSAQRGDREHPGRALRVHLCWGNYPGPHHRDVPLEQIIDLILQARPRGLVVRGGQLAARARVEGLRERESARRQGADPGRDRIDVELHRASRARGAAASCASRSSSAART